MFRNAEKQETGYDECVYTFSCVENRYTYGNRYYPDEKCWESTWDIRVRVPVGYDGIVFAAYNKTAEIESLMAGDETRNEVILSDKDTLMFRMK